MPLISFAVQDFQSYREVQTITIDPRLTLIAGRNNVGKSALLRALRVFVEGQEGAGPGFEVTYHWRIDVGKLLTFVRGRAELDPLVEWLRDQAEHTVVAVFVINGGQPNVAPSNLHLRRVELLEVEGVADAAIGTNLGWRSGPMNGSATGADVVTELVNALVRDVAFIGPRLIEPGARQLVPQPMLQPDARNLPNVVAYLQLARPTTTFRELVEFMRQAFPEIETVTVMPAAAEGTGEPAIFYRESSAAVPLRLCGSGVEQMLALATGVLTVPAGRLFLIDEPQAYLHPHAERSFLSFLESHAEHQYVIATNSGFLLNSRPIDHARLLAMDAGATSVTEVATHGQLLAELEITAADLWLAEAILWVEGPSDVAILELVSAELGGRRQSGLSIRRMPGAASRFTSENESRAEETYRFCEEVIAAVTPLGVPTRFLFDSDDKSDEVKERIRSASGGRAEFLPVRELENLFLQPDLVHVALSLRCELLGRSAPNVAAVERELEVLLATRDDRKLYPRSLRDGEVARERVRGSEVLDRLFWQFTTSEYDKVEDGRALAQAALEQEPGLLDPLREVLRRLVHEQ